MSCTAENPLVLCIERVDMSGTAKVFGFAVGVGQSADGSSAISCRNARGSALDKVYGHRKRSTQDAGIVVYLRSKVQLLTARQGDGCT